HWFLDHLPAGLLRPFAFDLALFQWLALPALVFAAFALALGLGGLLRRVFAPLVRRSSRPWLKPLLASGYPPLVTALALAIGFVLLHFLGLPESATVFTHHLWRGSYLALLFWSFSRAIGMLESVGTRNAWAGGRRALVTLIPLGSRVGK